MKKTLFLMLSLILSAFFSSGQQFTPGTLESVGGAPSREVVANGLTQLFSATGNYTISADGAGNNSSSNYSIQVNKPNASATVFKAYLFCAPVWYQTGNCTSLNGIPITWDGSANAAWGCCNYYDDVTSIVAPIIDPAPAGILSISIYECNYIDGYGLLVIFADASAQEKTIVIMFGGLSTTGDNFSLTLGTPIDPNAPGALLDMGLGISFSYQGGYQSNPQYSIININGARLTTSAGGEDDGASHDGALMTVGGIGDINTNPADPYHITNPGIRYDDELYSLLPLITNTTSNILINTLNPSNNDNVFLAYFEISGAAIIGEGILLTQTVTQENVGANHTVKAIIQDDNGNPVVGKQVNFTVLSGPNAGANGTASTNASGEAFFTYTGTGGVGFDDIQACFQNSQSQTECSNVVTVEWIQGAPPVPVSTWALVLGGVLIAGAVFMRYRRIS
jgi:hypothetical protein